MPLSMIMGALPRPDAPPGPTLEGFLPSGGTPPAGISALESTGLRLLESRSFAVDTGCPSRPGCPSGGRLDAGEFHGFSRDAAEISCTSTPQ